jgi:hypothetical protein
MNRNAAELAVIASIRGAITVEQATRLRPERCRAAGDGRLVTAEDAVATSQALSLAVVAGAVRYGAEQGVQQRDKAVQHGGSPFSSAARSGWARTDEELRRTFGDTTGAYPPEVSCQH